MQRDASDVWSYLGDACVLPKEQLDCAADFVVGFGHFDVRIAQRCAELYLRGRAPKVVFTGGQGSGSADLNVSEAAFFKEEALRQGVPDEDIIVEARSANTPENWANSMQMLQNLGYDLEGRSFILVATPYRQRRVRLTCAKTLPASAQLLNAPPASSLQEDISLFSARGQALMPLLSCEVERIAQYARKGDILEEQIPAAILASAARLEALN